MTFIKGVGSGRDDPVLSNNGVTVPSHSSREAFVPPMTRGRIIGLEKEPCVLLSAHGSRLNVFKHFCQMQNAFKGPPAYLLMRKWYTKR